MYIKKKGKIIKIKTAWDIMNEEALARLQLIQQQSISSGVGGDTSGGSGSATP